MDPLSYFPADKEAFIAELEKDKALTEGSGNAPPPEVFEEAIAALTKAGSSIRSEDTLLRQLRPGLRAIILAKYRPVLPLYQNISGDQLPKDEDLKSLGLIGQGDTRWEAVLKTALETKVAGRDWKLGELIRQIARVEHDSDIAVGTAWPLNIEGGMAWITNRHVVASDYQPWYRNRGGGWEPVDDLAGLLNCQAVENGPADRKHLRSFNVVDVVAPGSYDIAALTATVPRVSGLDIVWDSSEIAEGKSLEEALSRRFVLVIGHPVEKGEQSEANYNKVFFNRTLKNKHLMPGRLMERPLGRHDRCEVLRHDASTLRGTSGSCIIDLGPPGTNFADPKSLPKTFGKVIGIHFSGLEEEENLAVPSWRLKELL